MGTGAIQGFGQLHLRSLETNNVYFGGFADVKIEGKNKVEKAFRRNMRGKKIQSDSIIGEEEYTAILDSQTFDIQNFSLGMGEAPSSSGVGYYYRALEAFVPLVTPYTIALPGLTVGNQDSVRAVIGSNGAWNLTSGIYDDLQLETVTTGTPTKYQVLATGGSTPTATFNSGLAGAPVSISWKVPIPTGALTIGLDPLATILSLFEISMLLVSNEFPNGLVFNAPQGRKTSVFALESSKVTVISNTFDLTAPAGRSQPYYLAQL